MTVQHQIGAGAVDRLAEEGVPQERVELQPLTDEQVRQIEDAVNDKVRANLEVTKTVMPIEEAKKSGAVAMFGEKYGEQVRIVAAGDYSREFCGGCHVNRTGDIGVFKIVSDRSLAAGVRRMEALTGRGGVISASAVFDPARPRLVLPGPMPLRCPTSATGS